ncbi:plasmid stabilization protein [Labrys miyagiensis]|uniref:Plasmid stabilization protein n=1 Tax=Labrys miyagiensis TaxID=346912 RepID=A0ABQ6CBL3_9HYPH|nr:type II toxin-antitoxin system RelE/ParE family toxin [Labrys miyagiensis]GLS17656.1 plasmid stabilization protein [Labrys miyagiensis]
MRRLSYTFAARRDFIAIQTYITRESGNPALGRRFTDRLRRQCRKLASLPGLMGRLRPELRSDIRSFAYQGYIILLRYEEDRLQIVNVVEGHRDIEAFFSRGSSASPAPGEDPD